MATGGFYNTSGVDALAAFAPTDNWDRRHQQKQNELQYANILESRARQEAQETQNQVQAQIKGISTLKAMPMELPDRPKVEAYINSLLNTSMKNVKENYGGDFKKWLNQEGETALMQFQDSFLTSGVYAKATKNKMEMDAARKAINAQENLIGSMDSSGNYQSAESMMLKFQNGEVDSFTFGGSYDAKKAQPYEYFGKMYNPNGSKFERTAVSEADKLAYAQSALNGPQGYDYYEKALKGRNIYYKTDPIEDQSLFNLDVAGKQANIAQSNASAANSYANAEKSRAEANKKNDPVQNRTYFQTQLSQTIGNESAANVNATSPAFKSVIPSLGVPVSDLATTQVGGTPKIVMNQFPNIKADEMANKIIGINVAQVNGKPKYTGTVKDFINISKGGEQYNLENVKHTIETSDYGIYVDGKETNAAAIENRYPSRAFKKYTVIVEPEEWDKKYKGIIPGEKITKEREVKANGKTKIEKKEFYRITGFTPVPKWYQNPEVEQTMTKTQLGQATTNEIFSTNSVEIPDWD